ncbi:hypothetical protein [Nocardioides alcanivorans]|uniref:hypothetical protein n=1 Tax=Nocardioides alcanivorans TaxID=2897352 RepID=UPI001F2A5569|nr:hypothetical protein [Nocardioides alcanivorans]
MAQAAERNATRRRDNALWLRTAAAGSVAALALAGCGALMPGGGGSADPTVAGPGVTDDSVKVVFVGVDLSGVQDATGFNTASIGDPEKQVEALEKWVNDNGGLGGRELDAVFRWYNAEVDSPAAEEQLCNQVSQDDQAFAVVLTGQFQSNARPCYDERNTLVLDATLVASDAKLYAELDPHLWTASYPEYDAFTRSYIEAMDAQGFFDGRDQVAIVAADNPVNRRAVEGKAVKQLEELGLDVEVGWVDTTDMGTIFMGEEQAAITFASKGIDRVFFLGGSRLASIFATIAGSKGLDATYGISTFDNPSFFVNNPKTVPAETMVGMVGIGFQPAQDLADEQLSFPSRAPSRSASTSTPKAASPSRPGRTRGSRFPIATRRDC